VAAELVGGVGAEPGDVAAKVGRQRGELVGGDGPAFGDQAADDVHDVQGVVEDDQVGQQVLNLISFSCSAGSLSASTPLLPNPSHWAKPW